MNLLSVKELEAFRKIALKYKNDYNELYDSLYQYMKTYYKDDFISNYDYKDEIENLLGIREHDDIVNYIIKKIKD
jgi:hypothetical protein